jgi:hypothetical protein
MPRIESLTVAALTMFFAVSLHAKNPDLLSYDASVLLPGSRVVAGDLSKDEFFITGKMEPTPVKVATNTVTTSTPLTTSTAPTVPHPVKPSIVSTPIKVASVSTHAQPKAQPIFLPKTTKHAYIAQASLNQTIPHVHQFVAMKTVPHPHQFVAIKVAPRPHQLIAMKKTAPRSHQFIATKTAIHPQQVTKIATANRQVDKIVTYTRLRNEDYANKITIALKQAVKNKHRTTMAHQVATNASKPHIEHKTTYYRFTKVTKSPKTKALFPHRAFALAKR